MLYQRDAPDRVNISLGGCGVRRPCSIGRREGRLMFEAYVRATHELSPGELDELRQMLERAFEGDYDATSWEHCLGGSHFMLRYKDELVSHAALVPRLLEQGDRRLRGVYGESMATVPELHGKGVGSVVAAMAVAAINLEYEIGAFGASRYHFYERMGARRWTGPTFVKTPDGRRPAAPARGAVMVLLSADSAVDIDGDLTTDWREGDIW